MFLASALMNNLMLFAPIVLVFIFFYFFMIKPEKKRQQTVVQMQSSIKKNDKVLTIGGIYGIVDDIKDEVVTLTIASGARMKVERAAIKRLITETNE
jgi:preprotein translocase subunit YajC